MSSFTFRNPEKSHFGETVMLHVKEHHKMRAQQVLFLNQQAGRFPTEDYATFIGTGGRSDAGPEPVGGVIRVPRGTTRRNLASVGAAYLPFPGRIYFTQAGHASLLAAFTYFMKRFFAESPVDGNIQHKGHPAQYSRSLIFAADESYTDPGSLLTRLRKRTGPVALIDIVNTAPHAATIEKNMQVMYDIAIGVADAYGPAVTVQYDYINSDRMGLSYAHGEGGPRPDKGGTYPAIYALPRVRMAVNHPTISNTRFTAPGRQASAKSVRRRRSSAKGRS